MIEAPLGELGHCSVELGADPRRVTLDTPVSIPNGVTMSSTLRVLTPCTNASMITAQMPGRRRAREPAWYFTQVPERKHTTNRVHIDLTTRDPDAIDRLVLLGAEVIGRHEVPGGTHTWTVLRDPEGNEFCVAAQSFIGWS